MLCINALFGPVFVIFRNGFAINQYESYVLAATQILHDLRVHLMKMQNSLQKNADRITEFQYKLC